jgi:putative ABC transport system substrate-binding protein
MTKNTRIFAFLVFLVILLAAGGYVLFKLQRKGPLDSNKVYHVGILSGLNLFAPIADSFKAEMTTLGYTEGKNIVYDLQKTNFEPEKEKQILSKFVMDNVDLIVGWNTEVAIEAKDAIKGTTIPLIFANAFIEGNNLVNSIRAPGNNLTGVRYPNVDVGIKRLEIMHEIVPQAKRIFVPYQKGYPSALPVLEAVRPAAVKLGVTLIEFPVENLAALDTELAKRSATGNLGFDAIVYIPEALSTMKDAFATIAKYTRAKKIPIGGSSVTAADYTTLFAVTVDSAEIGKLAAHLADKIIRGISAGTIPVVSPETFLIVNNKTATELGIALSNNILNKANTVIR